MTIDDEASPVEGNYEDTYVDQDPNNILRHSDLLDPSTTKILDHNTSHSISMNNLPDVRVPSITNNNKKPQNTENDSVEQTGTVMQKSMHQKYYCSYTNNTSFT